MEEYKIIIKFILGLGSFLGAIMVIAKFIASLNQKALKPFLDFKLDFETMVTEIHRRIDEIIIPIQNLEHRVSVLEKNDSDQEWRIKDSMEQRKLLLGAIRAILANQVEMGCVNQEIKEALKAIEDYSLERPFR